MQADLTVGDNEEVYFHTLDGGRVQVVEIYMPASLKSIGWCSVLVDVGAVL